MTWIPWHARRSFTLFTMNHYIYCLRVTPEGCGNRFRSKSSNHDKKSSDKHFFSQILCKQGLSWQQFFSWILSWFTWMLSCLDSFIKVLSVLTIASPLSEVLVLQRTNSIRHRNNLHIFNDFYRLGFLIKWRSPCAMRSSSNIWKLSISLFRHLFHFIIFMCFVLFFSYF